MINIAGNIVNYTEIADQYPLSNVQRKIVEILASSTATYTYTSMEQLKFELDLRKNIIAASRDLDRSRFSFRIFREAKCNEDYWNLTDEGGFSLKDGVKPSDAIRDIFEHGGKYGTECATAMVIVFLGALVRTLPEELYDQMFSNTYLMNWQHLDPDLGIRTYREVPDVLPGDCRYFKNPDVDPTRPEWQGENAIDLGDGTYYGHGVSIRTGEGIIKVLNSLRFSGATTSAYLMDSATRPNFKYIADRYLSYAPPARPERQRVRYSRVRR